MRSKSLPRRHCSVDVGCYCYFLLCKMEKTNYHADICHTYYIHYMTKHSVCTLWRAQQMGTVLLLGGWIRLNTRYPVRWAGLCRITNSLPS